MSATPFRATAALALAALATIPARASEKPRNSLQGHWKLNPELTERMRADASDRGSPGPGGGRRGGPPGGGGMGGPPPGGGFPGGGPPGGRPPGDRGGSGPRRGDTPGAPPAREELSIVENAGSVAITDSRRHTRTLPTDGSKVREEEGPDGPATLRAEWTQGGALEVRVRPEEGEKRTESFVASSDGEHLYLTITLSGRGDFSLRLAYDRVPDPPVEPPAPEL